MLSISVFKKLLGSLFVLLLILSPTSADQGDLKVGTPISFLPEGFTILKDGEKK